METVARNRRGDQLIGILKEIGDETILGLDLNAGGRLTYLAEGGAGSPRVIRRLTDRERDRREPIIDD